MLTLISCHDVPCCHKTIDQVSDVQCLRFILDDEIADLLSRCLVSVDSTVELVAEVSHQLQNIRQVVDS